MQDLGLCVPKAELGCRPDGRAGRLDVAAAAGRPTGRPASFIKPFMAEQQSTFRAWGMVGIESMPSDSNDWTPLSP